MQKDGWAKFSWEDFSKIPLSECKEYVDIVKKLMPIGSELFYELKTDFNKGLPETKRGVRYDYLCRLIGAIASVGESGYYQNEKI